MGKGEIDLPVNRFVDPSVRRFLFRAAWVLAGWLAVLSLGKLHDYESSLQARHGTVSAFREELAGRLTGDRLIDALSGMKLGNRPLRVSLDHSILAVDLRAESPGEIGPDVAKLARLAYEEYDNVNQVLVRVLGERAGSPALLLAAETRKGDWLSAAPADPSAMRLPIPGERDGGLTVRWTWTAAGKRWIGNFANS